MQQALLFYAKGFVRYFSTRKIPLFAQAISFKILVTIIPTALLVIGIVGMLVRYPGAYESILSFISISLPASLSGMVSVLNSLAAYGQSFTLIGSTGLIIAAGSLFHTFHMALGEIFQDESHPRRTFLRRVLFNIRMVLQVGVFLLASVLLTLAVQALGAASLEVLEVLDLDYLWVQDGLRRSIKLVGIVVPFLVTFGTLFQLYYFIPIPRPPLKSCLLGSLIATLFWELAKVLFTFYATNVNHFGWYKNYLEPAGSVGGTIGFMLVLFVWVYFSCLILLLGAVFVLLHQEYEQAK